MEEDLFLWCFRFTNRALSRANCTQIDQVYRGGEAAVVDDIASCAQGAQLVVCLVYARMRL